nr:tellurite resistance TerB family protein [Roseococcus suduntuyensis]
MRGAAPPRRRAARPGAFGLTQTQTRQIGRALGTLAAAAAAAMAGKGGAAPAPAPRAPARTRATAGEPPRPAAPARRVPETAPAARPEPVPEVRVESAEARLMLRAMIAAAKADGVVDRDERAAILEQLNAGGFTDQERDALLADFDRPATPQELGRAVRDPMLAAQVYAAAVFAAADMTEPERAWLDQLGTALKLDATARQAIEARLHSM